MNNETEIAYKFLTSIRKEDGQMPKELVLSQLIEAGIEENSPVLLAIKTHPGDYIDPHEMSQYYKPGAPELTDADKELIDSYLKDMLPGAPVPAIYWQTQFRQLEITHYHPFMADLYNRREDSIITPEQMHELMVQHGLSPLPFRCQGHPGDEYIHGDMGEIHQGSHAGEVPAAPPARPTERVVETTIANEMFGALAHGLKSAADAAISTATKPAKNNFGSEGVNQSPDSKAHLKANHSGKELAESAAGGNENKDKDKAKEKAYTPPLPSEASLGMGGPIAGMIGRAIGAVAGVPLALASGATDAAINIAKMPFRKAKANYELANGIEQENPESALSQAQLITASASNLFTQTNELINNPNLESVKSTFATLSEISSKLLADPDAELEPLARDGIQSSLGRLLEFGSKWEAMSEEERKELTPELSDEERYRLAEAIKLMIEMINTLFSRVFGKLLNFGNNGPEQSQNSPSAPAAEGPSM